MVKYQLIRLAQIIHCPMGVILTLQDLFPLNNAISTVIRKIN